MKFSALWTLCGVFVLTSSRLICAEPKANKTIKDALVDESKNIHVIYDDGSDVKLTNNGSCDGVEVSPDKLALGWLVYFEHDRGEGLSPYILADELKVQIRDSIYTIKSQNISSWVFWNDWNHVAIHSGPLHGYLGNGELYDLSKSSEKPIETYSYNSNASPPEWAP